MKPNAVTEVLECFRPHQQAASSHRQQQGSAEALSDQESQNQEAGQNKSIGPITVIMGNQASPAGINF